MEYVSIEINEETVIGTLVAQKSGWVTIGLSDGSEVKRRKGDVNFEPDMSQEPVTTRDVIPQDIRDSYEKGKTAEGVAYIDSGDEIAQQLRGKPVIESAKVLAKLDTSRDADGWIAFYTTEREAMGKRALNDGMVRMNIGNRIRAALKAAAQSQAA